MHRQIKRNHIIFIVISLIFFNAWSSQLYRDAMLIICKDLAYRDMTSLVCTNQHYNQILNASFYTKLLQSKRPTSLQRQLAYDEDLFKKFYRMQINRCMGLKEEEKKSFGLDKLFAANSNLINKLITDHVKKKYASDDRITISGKKHDFNHIIISPKKYTLDEQVSFFSTSQALTKYEQTIIALPLLIKKIEKKKIEDVQELLKAHDQFDCIWPYMLLKPLCTLGDYSIVKKFIEDKKSFDANRLDHSALEEAHLAGSLPLFTDLLNNLNNNDCVGLLHGTLVKILEKCIEHAQIDWVRTIVQCKKYDETVKQKIVNQHFESACKNSACDIIELLLPYGPSEHATEVALIAACNSHNRELIHWLIDKQNADVNYLYKNGQTILEYFLTNENFYWPDETILIFLQKTNITLVNENKQTLLHLAVKNNNESVTRILLDKGANVNCVDCYNQNSLHYVMKKYNYYSRKILELLLEKGR